MEKDGMRHIKARRLLVDGTPMVDLRVFVIDAKGRHRPTRSGFWFPPEHLPKLRQLVDRLIKISPEASQQRRAEPSADQELRSKRTVSR
jgi:hypothetical protein